MASRTITQEGASPQEDNSRKIVWINETTVQSPCKRFLHYNGRNPDSDCSVGIYRVPGGMYIGHPYDIRKDLDGKTKKIDPKKKDYTHSTRFNEDEKEGLVAFLDALNLGHDKPKKVKKHAGGIKKEFKMGPVEEDEFIPTAHDEDFN